MQRLWWVVGLGTLGFVLFGPPGGSIMGAIGFVIGSGRATAKKEQHPPPPALPLTMPSTGPENEQLVPLNLSPDGVVPDSNAEAQRRHLVLFTVGMLLIGCVAYFAWSKNRDDKVSLQESPSPAQVYSRPSIEGKNATWSIADCLQNNFGRAISAGFPLPPEVRLYCAYPWDDKYIAALHKGLAARGVSHENSLIAMEAKSKQAAASLEIWRMTLNMGMPDGVLKLADISKTLPILWSASTAPDQSKLLLQHFTPEYVETLRQAAAVLSWDKPIVIPMLRAHTLVPDASARVVTDRAIEMRVKDLAEVSKNLSTAPVLRSLLEENGALRANPVAAKTFHLMEQGLLASHAMDLGLLELQAELLDATAAELRSSQSLPTAWKPVVISERSRIRPLEVYWLKHAPSSWCGGTAAALHAQYCRAEDRVFVRTEPEQDGPTAAMNAELLHEMGHSYLNPVMASDAPFVTEGIITAFGERLARATSAAAPALKELTAKRDKAMLAAVASPWTLGDSALAQKAAEFARQSIAKAPPTRYEKQAACTVRRSPLTVEETTRLLSLSNGPFRSLNDEESRRAYAYGWALFHHSLDVASIGLGSEGGQLDATPLQLYAEELAKGRSLSGERRKQIQDLLDEVQKRVVRMITERRITC